MPQQRRDKGSGSWDTITKNGTEYVRFRIKYPNQTKSKEFYGKTKTEVNKKRKAYEASNQHLLNNSSSYAKKTLRQYSLIYLETQRTLIKAGYYDTLYSTFSCYITKYPIADVQMALLTNKIVQDHYTTLADTYSMSTIKKCSSFLHKVIDYAVLSGDVEYAVSPFAGVKLPAREKIAVQEKPHSFLTLDDLKKFEETCLLTKKPGDGVTGVAIGAPIYGINAYACLLIVYTGLRIGELLGLKWKNIDMDKKELRVEATQKRVRDWDGESGGRYVWKVGETKTPTGYRIVPLSKKACDTIQLIKQCNTHHSPDDYVILSRNGRTPSESTMTRTLRGILQRAEIPDKGFGLHDLRHSFGSLLLEKGTELNKPVNMKYVSDLLGHKDVAFTSNIYVHATKEDKSSVVKLLDE